MSSRSRGPISEARRDARPGPCERNKKRAGEIPGPIRYSVAVRLVPTAVTAMPPAAALVLAVMTAAHLAAGDAAQKMVGDFLLLVRE